MPFPAQVLQQAQYDASVGGKNMPKNAFQRAQSFLRSKLMPGAPTPNPSTMTSQQQAAFDAKQGGRLLQEFNKTRTAGGPIGAGQNIMGGLITGGLIGANLAGLKQVDNIIQEEGGYGKLGERMLGLITRTDGLEDFKNSQRPKASGTKIKIGDKLYDTGFHSKEIAELRKKSPGGGNAAQSTTTYTPPVTGGLDTGSGNRDAKLDPNAKDLAGVMYVSNFKDGQTDMNAMQDYFKGQKNGENLAKWAKANPALAYKEYSKARNKEKSADMAAYEEDYGSPMNQQSEQVFEQGKPDVITTSQFDVLSSPTELSAPTRAAYDLVMANDNPIANIAIPEGDIPQDFLSTHMKKYGLIK